MARESHAHRIDLDRRPAGDGRISVRAHRGAVTSSDPIGRRAPIDLPCQRHDPNLWFADTPADLERAKALCAGCPAMLGCLTGAIHRRERAGVWGGQIFDDGRIVTHKRPRGRPRKDSTRAVAGYHEGRPPDLTRAEQDEVLRRLTELGKSARDIAEQLAATERTVSRRRAALNVAAVTCPAPHTAPRPINLTH